MQSLCCKVKLELNFIGQENTRI